MTEPATTGQSAPPPPDAAPRCIHCGHTRRDHSGRADHRERYGPAVAGGPWCHACESECDYQPSTPAETLTAASQRLEQLAADDEATRAHHVVDGALYLCHTDDHYCPPEARPATAHACPPDGSGLTPCCRRSPAELPRTDRMTGDPNAVTCPTQPPHGPQERPGAPRTDTETPEAGTGAQEAVQPIECPGWPECPAPRSCPSPGCLADRFDEFIAATAADGADPAWIRGARCIVGRLRLAEPGALGDPEPGTAAGQREQIDDGCGVGTWCCRSHKAGCPRGTPQPKAALRCCVRSAASMAAPTAGLREQIDTAIRPVMLIGLDGAELDGDGGRQRIGEWADWIRDTVMAVIGPDAARARAELDRCAELNRQLVQDAAELTERAGRATSALARVERLLDEREAAVREIEAESGPRPWTDTVANMCAHLREAITGPPADQGGIRLNGADTPKESTA